MKKITVQESADRMRDAFKKGKSPDPADLVNVLGDPVKGVYLQPASSIEIDDSGRDVEEGGVVITAFHKSDLRDSQVTYLLERLNADPLDVADKMIEDQKE